MKIEQIILKPFTTPEYSDPAEARRYIHDDDGFYGYDYVFLEDATWNARVGAAGRGVFRQAERAAVLPQGWTQGTRPCSRSRVILSVIS